MKKDMEEAMNSLKPKRQLNSNFTESIMKSLDQAAKRKVASGWFAKFNNMPRFAAVLIALGASLLVGGVAYAAYHWIAPKVSITSILQSNDDHKKEYTIDSQCGEFYSGKGLKYELPQGSKLSDADVTKVFQNTCAYDAVGKFIDSQWVSDNSKDQVDKKKIGGLITIYQHTNMFTGNDQANSIFGLTIGNVTQISQDKVTIALPIYSLDIFLDTAHPNGSNYYPGGKIVSRTLSLAPNVEVWENGQRKNSSDVKVGDQIQVVTESKNKAQYYEDIHQKSLGEQVAFDVVGIIKTNIDTKYVGSSSAQIGDPAIVDDIAGLRPCSNNPGYLCVLAPNQIMDLVYGLDADDTRFRANKQYLRKGAFDKGMKTYELNGRIKSMDGTKITAEARGKKATLTINLPYDAITQHNSNPKPVITKFGDSPGLKVGVGDLIQVMYTQKTGEDPLRIKSGDIIILAALELARPDGTVSKY